LPGGGGTAAPTTGVGCELYFNKGGGGKRGGKRGRNAVAYVVVNAPRRDQNLS